MFVLLGNLPPMEVPDGRFNTRNIIDVVDAFRGSWCSVTHEVYSVDDVCGGGDLVSCIEGLQLILAVEDESICVFVLDIFNQWHPP